MDNGQSVGSEQPGAASDTPRTAVPSGSSAPSQQTDSAAGKAASRQQNRVTTNRACDNCRRRKVRCLPGFEETVCAHTSVRADSLRCRRRAERERECTRRASLHLVYHPGSAVSVRGEPRRQQLTIPMAVRKRFG